MKKNSGRMAMSMIGMLSGLAALSQVGVANAATNAYLGAPPNYPGLPAASGYPAAMYSTDYLAFGDTIKSANGQYQLTMQSDGNLVFETSSGSVIWAAGTNGLKGQYAIAQPDGNFVVYSPTSAPWAAGSNQIANNGVFVVPQNDGNLVVYDLWAAWSSGTHLNGPASTLNQGQTMLAPGASLASGGSIYSQNGLNVLVMQTDGNLVLSNTQLGVRWSSGTANSGAVKATMQTDGNLVLLNSANQAVWSSGTSNHAGSVLYLQDDGNLVVYTPIAMWRTGSFLWHNCNNNYGSIGGSTVYVHC